MRRVVDGLNSGRSIPISCMDLIPLSTGCNNVNKYAHAVMRFCVVYISIYYPRIRNNCNILLFFVIRLYTLGEQ